MVLVRPSGGSNVGAVCRAIKNMGAGRLFVVDGAFDLEEARRMAVHAADVLEQSCQVPSLEEAIAGCSLVVGTTARGGAYRERSRDIRDMAAQIARAENRLRRGAMDARVPALVFGPEDSGLTNRDIGLCHHLAHIPASERYASLNLAQAVLVCLYEVFRVRLEPSADFDANCATPTREFADAGGVERMFAALEEALISIGFLSTENPAHVMMTLRSLLARAGLDDRELRILRGLARQISWFADAGWEIARNKRERGEKLR